MGIVQSILTWFMFLLFTAMIPVLVYGYVKAARTRDRELGCLLTPLALIILFFWLGWFDGILMTFGTSYARLGLS